MKTFQWILIISALVGLAVLSIVVVKRTKKQASAPSSEPIGVSNDGGENLEDTTE